MISLTAEKIITFIITYLGVRHFEKVTKIIYLIFFLNVFQGFKRPGNIAEYIHGLSHFHGLNDGSREFFD